MKFIKQKTDAWHTVSGEDGATLSITPAPYLLLSLAQWHGIRSQWPTGMAVGVTVPNDVAIEDLSDDLPRLSLVALQFPKWTDGRAYSQAHLLRSRLRFGGDIRATDQVLVDMMLPLKRTGFTSVVLRADQSRESAERALTFFAGNYQADVLEHRPHFGLTPEESAALLTQKQRDFVQIGASI
jgi:uncharacterized protein (DUF934 family)